MNRLWNRFCNYCFDNCFLCGKRIWFIYATVKIGRIDYKMHDGPIQNCADQHHEWDNRPAYLGSGDEHLTMLHR